MKPLNLHDPWRGHKKLKKGDKVIVLSGPLKPGEPPATVLQDDERRFVVEYPDGRQRWIPRHALQHLKEG